MKLQKGWIYHFKYDRYRKDPTPLALILYADNKIAHAINISYLNPILTNDLIDMLIMIANNRVDGIIDTNNTNKKNKYKIIKNGLDGEDTYKLYHGYIKNKLGAIVKKAYRIYFVRSIRELRPISKGFDTTTSYLNMMKKQPVNTKEIIRNKITKEIAYVQKTNKKVLTPIEAEEWAIAYVKAAKEISKLRINKNKYTGIKNFKDLER